MYFDSFLSLSCTRILLLAHCFHVVAYGECTQRDAQVGARRRAGVEDVLVAALIPISSEPTGKSEEEAFLYAVQDVNAKANVLVQRHIVPLVCDTKSDPWTGFQSAVDALSKGAVAGVGPGLSAVATVVSPLATHASVPFVTPTAPAVALALHDVHQFVLQLSPSDRLLSQAVVDIVVHFKWQHVGIVRSNVYYGRNRFGNINTVASENGIKIMYTAQIPSSSGADGKQLDIAAVAGEMAQLRYLQARIIVVDVLDRDLPVVFRAADQLGMIGQDYVWIVSSESPADVLDPQMVKLMEGTLGVSTASPERAKQWQTEHNITSEVNVYQLYTYDSVWLLARALDSFIRDGHSLHTVTIEDNSTGLPAMHKLSEGAVLLDYIRNVSFEGQSGEIKLTTSGERTKTLDIVNMVNGSFRTVGQWHPHGQQISERVLIGGTYPRVVWTGGSTTVPLDRTSSLKQTVHAMVMVTQPFVFYKESAVGNARFSGYLIDIFEELRDRIGFQYHLEKWNGTQDEVVKYIAAPSNPFTVAVADVIITSERWKQIDFTTSLHLASLAMLLQAPEVASASGVWGFLAPFHYSVWVVLLSFFFFSAIVLKITESCRRFHTPLKMGECLWMSFSVFFGTHKDDKVTSMFGRGWLIVTLMTLMIINAAYTAVLTTFLLSKEIKLSVTEVQDLLNEHVGTIRGTHTATYLRNIEGLLHVHEIDLHEAPEAVLNGSVRAFISPRVSLQYIADENCSVYVPSSDYDIHKENIGFAVQKGNVLTQAMNAEIQKMWDSNYLSQLYKRHFIWTSRCDDLNTITDVDTIDLQEVGGIFIVLAVVTVATIVGQFLARRWCPSIGYWCDSEDQDEANSQVKEEEVIIQ